MDDTITKISILLDLLHTYTMELNSESRHVIKSVTNDIIKRLNRLIREFDRSPNFPSEEFGEISDKIKYVIDYEIQNGATN